ncbi:fibroblast growth factor 21 [Struthio camelus]|uniref:fibroblast growth factor 21 n=1 Tax=Struthio camelus TaxID=8801 RepID=UPI003603CA3B
MRAAAWLALAALCCAAPGRGAPRDSSPLLALDGQVRLRHLLAGDGRSQALLEILPSGEVRGAAQRSPYSLLEIKAVKPGVVRIRGARTLRFLCLDGAGRPYGAESYSAEACNFRERVRRDGYNLYESERLRRPLGLELEPPPGPGPGPSYGL